MNASRALLAAVTMTALAGCVSLAPQYQRPAAPMPAVFRNTPSGGAEATPMAALDWQSVFLDPRLRQVIAMSLAENRDLRVAMLNVEKVRAQYRIQRAELLPSLDARASRTSQRSATGILRSADASIGVSNWELDLFGRVRSLKNAALQSWLATAEAQRSARMSLLAEVATDWLNVGALRRHLTLARKTLESQRETLRLTGLRHDQGVVSGVDLAQVRTSVESARADVASYYTALAQARNALELVVGTPVSDELLPALDAEDAVALAPVPAGLSSAVLLNRPDVLAAEHALEAANADIGAARAAFFPSITLTGSAGRSSGQLSDLFDTGASTWSFVPSLTLPIFRAGALRASLDVAKIQTRIEVATYEKTLQTAFREASDALVARSNVAEQLDAQRALVTASRHAYALTDLRYRNGASSYLEALDAQRTLYGAQQALITLELNELTNRVTLYKVLGGGADATAVSPTTAAPAPPPSPPPSPSLPPAP